MEPTEYKEYYNSESEIAKDTELRSMSKKDMMILLHSDDKNNIKSDNKAIAFCSSPGSQGSMFDSTLIRQRHATKASNRELLKKPAVLREDRDNQVDDGIKQVKKVTDLQKGIDTGEFQSTIAKYPFGKSSEKTKKNTGKKSAFKDLYEQLHFKLTPDIMSKLPKSKTSIIPKKNVAYMQNNAEVSPTRSVSPNICIRKAGQPNGNKQFDEIYKWLDISDKSNYFDKFDDGELGILYIDSQREKSKLKDMLAKLDLFSRDLKKACKGISPKTFVRNFFVNKIQECRVKSPQKLNVKKSIEEESCDNNRLSLVMEDDLIENEQALLSNHKICYANTQAIVIKSKPNSSKKAGYKSTTDLENQKTNLDNCEDTGSKSPKILTNFLNYSVFS